MSSIHITQGIILKRKLYRETSYLCHCLTEDHGIIPIIAKGVNKEKSSFTGFLEPFNLLNLELHQSDKSEIFILRNAGIVKSYLKPIFSPSNATSSSACGNNYDQKITDYNKCQLLNAAAELILQIEFLSEESESYFHLFDQYCTYVTQTAHHPYLIFLRFVWRLFTFLGVPININCYLCNSSQLSVYDSAHHSFLCSNCVQKNKRIDNSHESMLNIKVADRRNDYGKNNVCAEISPHTAKVINDMYNINSIDIALVNQSVLDETKNIVLMHLMSLFHKNFHLNSLRDYSLT